MEKTENKIFQKFSDLSPEDQKAMKNYRRQLQALIRNLREYPHLPLIFCHIMGQNTMTIKEIIQSFEAKYAVKWVHIVDGHFQSFLQKHGNYIIPIEGEKWQVTRDGISMLSSPNLSFSADNARLVKEGEELLSFVATQSSAFKDFLHYEESEEAKCRSAIQSVVDAWQENSLPRKDVPEKHRLLILEAKQLHPDYGVKKIRGFLDARGDTYVTSREIHQVISDWNSKNPKSKKK